MANKKISAYKKTNLPILIGLFLIPLSFLPFISNSFTSAKSAIYGIIGLWCLVILSSYKKFFTQTFHLIKNNKLFLTLCLSLVLSLISSIINPHWQLGLYGNFSRNMGLIHHILGIFIVLYIYFFYKSQKLHFKIISFSNIILILYGILQSLNIEIFFSNYNFNLFAGRIFSLIGNPSYFGQILTLLIGLNIYKLYNIQNPKWRLLEYALIFGNIYCLLLSQTRTALIALTFLLVALGLIKFKKHLCSRVS